MKKKRTKKQKKEELVQPVSFKEKVTNMLELPKEVILNFPVISMVGNEELHIENYKGILEYDTERIRIYTSNGIIRIEGRALSLKTMTMEEILIKGVIMKIEFYYNYALKYLLVNWGPLCFIYMELLELCYYRSIWFSVEFMNLASHKGIYLWDIKSIKVRSDEGKH